MSRQQDLFQDAAELKWQRAEAEDRLFAGIVFNRPMETEYHYEVPDGLREMIQPGQRVRAPLGRGDRLATGFCVSLCRGLPPGWKKAKRVKSLESLLDREPLADEKMLALTKWIAEYYLCSWGQVLNAVIPAAIKKGAGTRKVKLVQIAESIRDQIDSIQLPSKQQAVVDALRDSGEWLPLGELAEAAGCGVSPINTLLKKGFLEAVHETQMKYEPASNEFSKENDLQLSSQQQLALYAITKAIDQIPGKPQLHAEKAEHVEIPPEASKTFLLHGVTGSGKTEVYIRAIREVVSRGRQAIVLVPEISLTPQTIRRFRRRFDSVAVLHSHLTDVERHWQWQQIASGQVQVVVGARSAIFAPTPRLGLIIIDEEHETTFKQETIPRYHAREVARKRAELEGIPLVLGSATPMLESWWHAKQGNFKLISMPERIEKLPMPPVVIVDIINDPLIRHGHNIGRALKTGIDQALKNDGQIILFYNLRGFTPVLWCRSCGEKLSCPHCTTSLTWHKDRRLCLCHTCDYTTPIPPQCPSCKKPGLKHFGSGTQKLEEEVRSKFPGVSVVRMDSDSMRKHGSHDEALERFRHGEVSILLGTQMIAKGLDFPNVTLVGVVDADTALHQIDFRASERTFQLISQVAGRTGRSSRGGRVLVQTMQPDAEAIRYAAEHDYVGFAQQELGHRQDRKMPPQNALMRVIIRGKVESTLDAAADEMATIFHEESAKLEESYRVLGPAPAPLARHKDYFRYQIMITGASHLSLCQLMEKARPQLDKFTMIEFAIDVDPLQMR